IRIRSFFTFVPSERYRHAHCRPMTCGLNMKLAADQFYSFLHAGNAHTTFELRFSFPSLNTGREPATRVANFQREIGVAMNSYRGSLTSRMALDVSETLLYDSKQSQFR